MRYHIGLIKGKYYPGCRDDTLVVQMRRNIDFLDCEIWEYLGEFDTTKKHVRENRDEILRRINEQYGTNFRYLRVE